MAKKKIKAYQPELLLQMRLTWKEEFHREQCSLLQNRCPEGLLRLEKISRRTASFTGRADMTLAQYLRRDLDQDTYFCLIVQLINVLRSLSANRLPATRLELNVSYVFIDSTTKRLSFLYCPIESEEARGQIRSFLEHLAGDPRFIQIADTRAQEYLLSVIRENGSINTMTLQKYVESCCPAMAKGIMRAGAAGRPRISDSRSEYLRQMNGSAESARRSGASCENGTDLYYRTDSDSDWQAGTDTTVLPEAGTTVLDEGGTIVLDEQTNAMPALCLLWKRTGEEIRIDRPEFRVGKEEGSDFIIPDNPAVSRNHSSIFYEDGKCYICDNNSTNRTYVNNVVAPPGRKIELRDGARVRMADEDFEFRIMEY